MNTTLQTVTGWVAAILGSLMILGSAFTAYTVSDTLEQQNIVVAEDASFNAGEAVNGPFDAYAQADIINQHTLDATDGKTYAELERDDPLRDLAMRSAFLQASLFTSVVAFGVAGLAGAAGVLFVLVGLGILYNKQ